MSAGANLGRWLVSAVLAGALPPEEPEILRLLAGFGWRLERPLRPRRRAMIEAEARRVFGVSERTAAALSREAHDIEMQSRLEELVLPRLDPLLLQRYVRVEGEIGPGLLVFPRMGNPLMLVAALGHLQSGAVVVAAGIKGEGRLVSTLIAERARQEARLPVTWERDAGRIAEHLRAGRLVMVAMENRGGEGVDVPFLGGIARLGTASWLAARATGVLPATIHRDADKTWRIVVGSRREADPVAYAREWADPAIRARPGQYLPWLVHCRRRGQPMLREG